MVQLVPMSEEEFKQFLAWAVEDYAKEQVKSGAWLEENSEALSQQAFESRLPEGVATADQFLLMIKNEEGAKVGQLWWGIQQQGENRFATLNDFHIFDAYRRQGLGGKALDIMEEMMRQEGLNDVYLHVFGHNEPARRLYRNKGYVERNVTMRKSL